jgi:hypothetical protein
MLFVAAQCVVLGLVGWLYGPDRTNYMAATSLKNRILRTRPSPRLILVGGSNVRQSTSAQELERALGRNVVNMGLLRMVGHEWMMREVEPYVRDGDVVVLSFEQRLFGEPSGVRGEAMLRAIEQWPANVRCVTLRHAKPLLDTGVFPYLGLVVRRVIHPERSGAIERFDPQTGQMIRPPPRRRGEMPGGVVFPPDFRPVYPERIRRDVNAFAAACRARGARVFYSHTAIPTGPCEEWAETVAEIERRFHDGLGVPVLNTTAEARRPVDHFANTVYHLNDRGRAAHTNLLIVRLRRHLDAEPPVGRTRGEGSSPR